jgi:hypothetical protein
MYVPQHSENVCISTFRKCMYLYIQKLYVSLHSENVCTSTFRRCMYLNIQKMYVSLHSENVCTSTFIKCMYLYIQKMYVPQHSENVCTSTSQALVSFKKYMPSSSLLQGKHLPFSPSPLRLNIFRLFVILSLTQLYRYTFEIFLFSTATFKYKYWAPLRRIGQEKSANVAY